MSFDATTLKGQIKYQADSSKVGVYTFELSCWYDIPINYKVQRTFKLTILHQCLKNTLTPSAIAAQTYFIGDPDLTFDFLPWVSLYKVCEPIAYTSKQLVLTNSILIEQPLPDFITFDPLTRGFKVKT